MEDFDEEIPPEYGAVFTISRMNPPTSGHVYLIKEMILRAMKTGATEVCIILSSSLDDEKNPIACQEKKRILEEYIIQKIKENITDEYGYFNININVECFVEESHEKNTFFNRVIELMSRHEGQKIELMVGSDRVENFTKTFKGQPLIEIITPGNVRGVGNAMSGTKLRGFFIEDMNNVIDLIKRTRTELNDIEYNNTTLDGISNFFNEVRRRSGLELFNIEPIQGIGEALVRGGFAEEMRKIGIPDSEEMYLIGLMLNDNELIYNFWHYVIEQKNRHTTDVVTKMGGIEEMGGGKTNKRKTNKRKTNKRKTNKRKTNKRKTNKRKPNKRKTNKRKTNKRKTNKRKTNKKICI
jgi:hypothetical protein